MKTVINTIFAGVFLFTVACNQSTKQAKTNSTGNESAQGTISGDEVTACPHQSNIFWKGSKIGLEHYGIIKLKEGKYFVDDGNLVGGEFIIDMNSLVDFDIKDTVMNAKLVDDLKSANFFNVDSFPEGQFVITRVLELKESSYTHEIKGNLTLKSITHPISFKVNVKVANGIVTATSEEFVLNRTLWNVNYGSKSIYKELKDKFINDEIKLVLELYSM